MPSALLTPETLPKRLAALGWKRAVRVRGLLSEGPAVAIVGARAATQIGMDRAHALAKHLAGRGVRVVSGGALGIDGAAHRGALAAGLATGGAMVSELADNEEPRRSTFVQRNKLIAALADCVLVIEAEVRSGSLSTARAAIELGRVVAAWPGSPGCDRLLATGAGMLESADDAERALAGAPRPMPEPDLDPVAQQVRDAIRGGAVGVDAIVMATGLAVRAVLRALPSIYSVETRSLRGSSE